MGSYQGDDTTGFQSPAQDYIEGVIDLSRLLDLRRPGLYPLQVVTNRLHHRGIYHGDILIGNAAADPEAGKVCVAFLQGEKILAELTKKGDTWFLAPVTKPAVPVTEDVEIWAIITTLVRIKV